MISPDLNELFTAAQIDSTLLLTRLDRKNPKAHGKSDHSDEGVRDLLLKVAAAYRKESKVATVELDAKDEKVLAKAQLAQKFSKIFVRQSSEGRDVTFRINPIFAAQLTKQIQNEQHREAHRGQAQDRRAARALKSESMLNSSPR